ncbi:MAG: hydroxyethylthiazole kinase [Salinarimonas sp.]|nr:hydroxyethylthiazole kinase [Salinarimonas sp.]
MADTTFSPISNTPCGVDPQPDLAARCAGLLKQIAAHPTRVHAITNAAAQVFTANLLLAAGAIPSLTHARDEAAAFAARADALVINLGTLDEERRHAIPLAMAAARDAGHRIVLDPVFVDRSPPRLAYARELLERRPAILRCNAAEFEALTGAPADPDTLRAEARRLACVIALTGAVDLITDGERLIEIHNGHPLMARVTAMGCAGTALIAAFASREDDALIAAASGLLALGIAGEIAGSRSAGPGSFQPAFLDALYGLDGETIATKARTS